MRNAMSTVSMVGCEPATIIGTDSTDSIVTKDRTSADQQRLHHLRQHELDQHAQARGAEIARRPRSSRGRARPSRRRAAASTNGICFQTKVMMMPRQSRKLAVWQRLEQPDADEGVVHQPVLGEEGAHALRRDDERNEQRPAIERSAARATSQGVSPSVRCRRSRSTTSADQRASTTTTMKSVKRMSVE